MSKRIKPVTIVIIEDHAIFIEGLCSVLRNAEGITVAGVFDTGSTALPFIEKNEVDLVLLDISLPDMSGIDLARTIKALNKKIRIVALTNHTEKSVIMEMLQQGADGYLLKNTSKQELISAIDRVMDNKFLMNNELQKILFSPERKTNELPRLTQREKQVLKLVSEGATTAAIAKQLFISPQTVETHRHNLMQKFEVSNSASLIRKAGEYDMI